MWILPQTFWAETTSTSIKNMEQLHLQICAMRFTVMVTPVHCLHMSATREHNQLTPGSLWHTIASPDMIHPLDKLHARSIRWALLLKANPQEELLIANPQEELFGPFPVGDPDVVPVTTRQLILVPNKYAPFLSAGMTPPRAAHAALSTMIQQDGNDIACERLSEWLRSALVPPAAQAVPCTAVAPLAPPAFLDPSDQQSLAQYGLSLIAVNCSS
jgi:hypothetical protein